MRHEFSVEEMDDDGFIPIGNDRLADIVGASIKFHFTDGNLECKILYASFNGRGNYCPRNGAVECDGCACLMTDKGEIMMCKDSNTFLRRTEQGDEMNE
jgi:hypothetical protein|tara:strand:+ start:674 stop:970 length:297 start_codon:yes stop_codon:yes gene_type:complete